MNDNIIMSILVYRDNHASDNTVDTTNTKSLFTSGCDLKLVLPLAPSALPF